MKIMSLDPGGTTGVAIMECSRIAPHLGRWTLDFASLVVAQYGTPQEDFAALRVFERIAKEAPDVLVMEDFRLFPDRRHSPDTDGTLPDRYLARLDLLLYLWKEHDAIVTSRGGLSGSAARCPLVRKQMPGERVVVTDQFIKSNGLWRTEKKDGGGPHAMDALRHLLVYYFKKISKGDDL